MTATNEFALFPIDSVSVSATRQRRKLDDLEGLAGSISEHGLLHPIVITRDGRLVAGERRLNAIKLLKERYRFWPDVQVHFFDALETEDLERAELWENIHRSDLTWQERCLAMLRIHDSHTEENWTAAKTASRLHISESAISKALTVGRELLAGNDKIQAASGISSAYTLISRSNARAIDAEIGLFLAGEQPAAQPLSLDDLLWGEVKGKRLGLSVASISAMKQEAALASDRKRGAVRDPELDITQSDFLVEAAQYSGPKFTVLHCDFPYGINFHKSPAGGASKLGKYEDSAETYYALIDGLISNQDRLCGPNTHMIFWLAMNHYARTVDLLSDAGWTIDPYPLIWVKSDGFGIAPDVLGLPKRSYEAALFCTRGKLSISSLVNNSISAPAAKATAKHPSEKVFLAVHHFLRLVVDDTSRVLDPTCGSGQALCAAEKLGAKRIVGWEISKDHVESARANLRRTRLALLGVTSI